MENNNPFSRKKNTTPSLGEITDIPDTQEEDLKKIEKLIPQPGDKSVEEGFNKMLNIMGKISPKMEDKEPSKEETTKETTNSIFSKHEEQKADKKKVEDVKKTVEVKKEAEVVEEKAKVEEPETEKEKIKTKSEELGLHYKDEEILPLIDSLLTKGYASESTNMRGNTITFRTSFLWEDREVLTRIDEELPNYNLKASGSFLYDLYSLASNLEQFGENYFKPVSVGTPDELEQSFTERVNFLKGLPSPFVTIISNKRLEFIKKVQFLIDNYDRLLQVF